MVQPMAPVVVIGAGPGIGAAVTRRFAKEGCPLVLIARTTGTLQAVADSLHSYRVPVTSLTADSGDETSLRAALDAGTEQLGVPQAVIYNAAIIRADLPGELSVQGHLEAWAVNVIGAITAASHLAPAMAQRGGGSILITGGMPEPDPRYTSLSLGKAGVRALVSLLERHYGTSGVHVATVTVAGAVEPGTEFDPDAIADHYWQLHTQPGDAWQQEIVHR